MLNRRSIAARLALLILVSCSLIFSLILGYNYWESRRFLEQELESTAHNLTQALVYRVESHLIAIARTTEGLARSVELSSPDEPRLLQLVQSTLADNPAIYGMAVAFEPYAFSARQYLYATYFHRTADQIQLSRLEHTYQHDTPYLYWDWYQIARELRQIQWSEPYFDTGAGNALMSTCSVPFYHSAAQTQDIKGITTADVSLLALTDLVNRTRVLETGYAMLLSQNGTFLAHPDTQRVMNESFFSLAETPDLRAKGRQMLHETSGFFRYRNFRDEQSWLYHARIPSTGWTLAVVFPEAELSASVDTLSRNMALLGAIGSLLLAIVIIVITRVLLHPLRQLASASNAIAQGEFDTPLPDARRQDEVGILTDDFNHMVSSLKTYMHDLAETTAAKERIQSELQVASRIQSGLLPRIFPAFPEHSELDLYASMVPAKEVGGDFYDFFFIDARRLCFLIADVSDKGVPAALYMMVCKTLLKSEGQRLQDPGEVLTSVNGILAADNENCMFATVFCGLLDIDSGELKYASAGHNPPVLIDAQGARFLGVTPALMLGPMEQTQYRSASMQLDHNEVLFLYTDGVTEARSATGALYGEQHLLQSLQQAPHDDARLLIEHVSHALTLHAHGIDRSDDITMLALRLRPNLPRIPATDSPDKEPSTQ